MKKVKDLGDWARDKVGEGRLGSKMGAGAVKLRKYARAPICEKEDLSYISGRLGDSDTPLPIEGLFIT